jgi:hypothetical protein
LREAPHVHRRLDRPTRAADMERSIVCHDVDDPEIDIWAQATVQSDLLGAVLFAPLARGEIDEAKVDWFLELVCMLAREDDPRNVGVLHREIIGRVVVRLGP